MRHIIALAIALPFIALALPACDSPDNEAELQALDIGDDVEAVEEAEVHDDSRRVTHKSNGTAPKGPSDIAAVAPDPSAISCPGYQNGGDYCMVRCNNPNDGESYGWYVAGHRSYVPYGACTAKGNKYCNDIGLWPTAHCWGFP